MGLFSTIVGRGKAAPQGTASVRPRGFGTNGRAERSEDELEAQFQADFEAALAADLQPAPAPPPTSAPQVSRPLSVAPLSVASPATSSKTSGAAAEPSRSEAAPLFRTPEPAAGEQRMLNAVGLAKSYVGRQVVRGASLHVRRGEAVGLLGPNGAGKTTIFYMITGLVKADAGRIELDGHDVTHLPMYRRARLGVGYLPQEASIFRGLTVEANIRAVLEVVERDRKAREHQLDELMEEFHIGHLRKAPSIALSGGERRRLEIARALASKPAYMLLDEPFAGIDPIAVADIQHLVRHLTSRGIGVLVTDHNVRETLGLIDRAYIIHAGQVLMHGKADDIVRNADVRRLYLGDDFTL